MGASDHKKMGKQKDFCPVRGKDGCECGNDHRDCCTPSWEEKWKFMQGDKGKSWGKWEAHHILSISCVNWLPEDATQREALLDVVRETTWCINAKRNMVAMPKFGHTIMYYVDIFGSDPDSEDFREIRRRKAPPFANIPQHDFEHDTALGYCYDVKTEIAKIWENMEEAKDIHKTKVNTWLAGRLNELSSEFRTKLRTRGKRQNGTHDAWLAGRKGENDKWYLPFSMATAAHAQERNHPVRDSRAKEKMIAIWNSLVAAGRL